MANSLLSRPRERLQSVLIDVDFLVMVPAQAIVLQSTSFEAARCTIGTFLTSLEHPVSLPVAMKLHLVLLDDII